jgi:O-antigen ligase
MLYTCLLLYVGLIYIRPAEIVSDWAAIPFVDILTVIAAVIGFFSLAARPRPFFNLPQDKFVLLFWFLIAVFSIKVWVWLAYAAWLAFMPIMFLYLLIRAAVTSTRKLKGLIYLLVFLNVFLAINGIVQYHTGVGLGDVTMKQDRIYGTGIFNDPNDLGMTFVMSLPLLITMMGSRKTWLVVRVLSIGALAAILLAMYYTNSRGTIVGLGAAMACYAFVRFRTVKATLAAVVFVAIIAVAAPSRGSEIDAEESSAQSRIQAWAAGWTMLKTYPLTGVGYDQFMEYHERVAHNSFVHTFAELGFIGAFCLVGMFYWYFKGLTVIPADDPELGPWGRALFVSAVGTIVCGWFLSRQYVPPPYMLLAIGASAASLRLKPETAHALKTKPGDIAVIAGLTVSGVVLVYILIRTMAIWGE